VPTILPEGVPWWAWALIAIAVAIATPLSGVVTAWITRGTRKGVQEVVEQTKNNHDQTAYPNMRDEITQVRMLAESIVAGQLRHDGEIANIRSEQQLTRGDVQALRTEHGETRAWVQAEAAERRAITTSVSQLTGSLETHILSAEVRDRQIAELQQTIISHRPDTPA
jgi:hypothetical protein